MKRWFVVHTRAAHEERAAHHLAYQGFEAYLPRYRKRRRHARRVQEVLRPLFPRYLFVRLNLDAERWRSINGTFGVTHLICHGNRPAPVPDGVVEAIVARELCPGIVELDPPKFRPGDRVRIEEGVLADRIGLFVEMADAKRVVLLLDLMGRAVRATASVNDLAAAS
jgi:transcriptional antiterminator RfaH